MLTLMLAYAICYLAFVVKVLCSSEHEVGAPVSRCHANPGHRDFHELNVKRSRHATSFYHPLDHSPGVTHNNCKDIGGIDCEDCCHEGPGLTKQVQCCEVVSHVDPFPIGQELWVPVVVVMFHPNPLPRKTIDDQFAQLNKDYKNTSIFFVVVNVQHVPDPKLSSMCNSDPCYESLKCDFFEKVLAPVIKHSDRYLYLILCETPYLGESSFPWQFVENDHRKYVQSSFHALHGVTPGAYYSLGRTISHEVGHYFGLLHTFWRDGMCDAAGDYVSDTPDQKDQTDSSHKCTVTRDTCPGPGVDDISNFMDYSSDFCMNHFTPGQAQRMQQSIRKFYPTLYAASAVRGTCPHRTDTDLSRCVCENGGDPTAWCGGTPLPPLSPSLISEPPITTSPPTKAPPSPLTPLPTTRPPLVTNATGSPPLPSLTPTFPPPIGPLPSRVPPAPDLCLGISVCNGGGQCVVVNGSQTLCHCTGGLQGTHCEYCPAFHSGWNCQSVLTVPDGFLEEIGLLFLPRALEDKLQVLAVLKGPAGEFTLSAPAIQGEGRIPNDVSPLRVHLKQPGAVLKVKVGGRWRSSSEGCRGGEGKVEDRNVAYVCYVNSMITMKNVDTMALVPSVDGNTDGGWDEKTRIIVVAVAIVGGVLLIAFVIYAVCRLRQTGAGGALPRDAEVHDSQEHSQSSTVSVTSEEMQKVPPQTTTVVFNFAR